jgi:hypothetical protein
MGSPTKVVHFAQGRDPTLTPYLLWTYEIVSVYSLCCFHAGGSTELWSADVVPVILRTTRNCRALFQQSLHLRISDFDSMPEISHEE